MQITFYVLNSTTKKASSDSTELEEAFLAFVCKLTQTVLKKSDQTLVILSDDFRYLLALDKQLWSFSASSFIPHDLCIRADAEFVSSDGLPEHNKSVDASTAPVILTDRLPSQFDGVVLNLATTPLHLMPLSISTTNTQHTNIQNEIQNKNSSIETYDNPNRLLEIIPADEANKAKGREKYSHYRSLGYQLQVHKIG